MTATPAAPTGPTAPALPAAPAAPAALARVEALSIDFPGRDRPAVDEVSFELRPGECVALVGESGSGKSLTAKALLGLLPEGAARSGRVFLGEDPAPPSGSPAWAALRGERTALVPQDALGGLDPLRRIELEVGDALRLHRLGPHRLGLRRLGLRRLRRERVVAALAAAGMPEPDQQLRRRSDELSGGLRQRALVASALIADPELIIADEPTTALDAGHRGRVLAELRRRVLAGSGVLLISHDLASVRDIADRVLVMREGRIIEQGDPRSVFDSPAQPFTRELVASSPAGVPRGVRLLAGRRVAATPAPTSTTLPTSTTPPASTTLPASTAPPPAAPPVRLELQGVTAGFGGSGFGAAGQHGAVLRDVSLTVRSGETVGLVGESGSGKTTLLRVALGLHAPQQGRVLIDGVDRSSAGRQMQQGMRRRVALVPQDPLDSFPRGASARAILEDALRAAGVPRRERAARANELATEVGLETGQLVQQAATLSGGQRQRLAIARALAREPELLLLDEAVSALDVTVQARVLDLLDDLQQRHGTAYLFVSHDAEVIAHMSDRVLRLEHGSLVDTAYSG